VLAATVVAALTAAVVAGCSSGSGTVTVTPAPSAAAASVGPAGQGGTDTGFPTDADGPVLDAARDFVEKVTTYDHTKLDDQLKAVLPLTADPLQGQLRSSLAQDGDFATTARSEARDAKGTVLDLGMVSREGNRAVVLVFVDQAVKTPSDTTTERLRERVTLAQRNGRWLANKLETL